MEERLRDLWGGGTSSQGAASVCAAERHSVLGGRGVVAVGGDRSGVGARRYADRLADAGYEISKTCLQNLLGRHSLGRRSQRYAAAARLALFTSELVTDAAFDPRADEADISGFCLWAAYPGALVGLDCFYIGKLKGVGEV